MDEIILGQLIKLISKESIQIKGLFFVVNFRNERFDLDQQEKLLIINNSFPLKAFWKHIIIIFTHYFSDYDEEDEDVMRNNRDKLNCEIFSSIMNKIKNVSDIIDYKEIKKNILILIGQLKMINS